MSPLQELLEWPIFTIGYFGADQNMLKGNEQNRGRNAGVWLELMEGEGLCEATMVSYLV